MRVYGEFGSAVGEVGIYTGSGSGIKHGVRGRSYVEFASRVRGDRLQRFRHRGLLDRGAGAVYTATAGGTPFMVSAPATGHSGIFPGINNAGTVAYGANPPDDSILTRTGTADAQTLVSDTALPEIERARRSIADRPLDQQFRHGRLLCQRK